MADRPYSNGIGIQIQCREDFDTLLEMEQMGGKIRDTENEYAGAEGRDDKTKFMISPRWHHHSYLPIPKWESPAIRLKLTTLSYGCGKHLQACAEKGMPAAGSKNL
jgi:hypothetical protein